MSKLDSSESRHRRILKVKAFLVMIAQIAIDSLSTAHLQNGEFILKCVFQLSFLFVIIFKLEFPDIVVKC